MDREQFNQHFHRAAARARSVAQRFVLEDLPERLRFRIELNCSYDGQPLHVDEHVFPQDGAIERAISLLRCTEQQAIEILWRDGLVPEWIDVSVVAQLPDATSIVASCCGRFTANAARLYHQREGYPPFHVLSPALPIDYEDGSRFSLFQRAECCTIDELRHCQAHAAKIWSLTLYGPVFDDSTLAKLPRFRNMELLEARNAAINGRGLTSLAKQPRLRMLSLRLHDVDTFSLQWLPRLRFPKRIVLSNLPRGDWAGPRFARRARRLESLWLDSKHPLELPGQWPRALTELRISAPAVHGGPIPTSIPSLSLRLSHAGGQ